MNKLNFSTFVGHFCPSGSGSGSTDPIESGSNPDPQPCFSRLTSIRQLYDGSNSHFRLFFRLGYREKGLESVRGRCRQGSHWYYHDGQGTGHQASRNSGTSTWYVNRNAGFSSSPVRRLEFSQQYIFVRKEAHFLQYALRNFVLARCSTEVKMFTVNVKPI